MRSKFGIKLAVIGIALVFLLGLGLACSSSNTPTPVPATPTAMAQPTSTAVPPAATPTSSSQPVYGGSLTYTVQFQTQTLDPVFMLADPSTPAGYIIFNQLANLGANNEVLPELAKSWDVSADGKTITLHLVQGVNFTDGTPFNADAVKYNLDRCLDPKNECVSNEALSSISNVAVVDENTVTLTLSQPWRPLLSALEAIPGMMPSPTAIKNSNSYDNPTGDFGLHPVGTGPFTLQNWQAGEKMTFVKNPNYWMPGKPYLDQIIFQNVAEPSTEVAMVRTGEADIVADVSFNDLQSIGNDPNVRIDKYNSGRVYHAVLNVSKPPFDNQDLRLAVAYAMDRDTAIKVNFGGEGRPAFAPIGQGWAYDPNLKPVTYDPNMAKQELAKAGYPNGVSIQIMCKSDSASVQLCETFQAQFKTVGINASIDQISNADYTPRRVARNYQMYFTYRTPLGDPQLMVDELYLPKGRGNYNDYSNPQVTSVLQQAGTEFDLTKAKALLVQAETLIGNDAPTPWYMFSTEPTLLSTRVQNFTRVPDLDLRFRDLWVSK